MSESMAAANKIFVPSVGPVCHSGSGACVLHLYVVCRAMTTQKFAPGTASGSVIEMVEFTTSACVGMLDGVYVLPYSISKCFCRWAEALGLHPSPKSVTITSWNEWGEGTQIEPAIHVIQSEKYMRSP